MLFFVAIAWPFLLLFTLALALAFSHTRWRKPVRHILLNGLVVFLILWSVSYFLPLEYDQGRDAIHGFCGDRFVLFDSGVEGYSLADEKGGTGISISSVFRWAERKEGCYLVSTDRHFHFLDPITDSHQEWETFDDVPEERVGVFREMQAWGPYGQLWEDLLHAGWRNYLYWGLVLAFVIHSISLLGCVVCKRYGDSEQICSKPKALRDHDGQGRT